MGPSETITAPATLVQSTALVLDTTSQQNDCRNEELLLSVAVQEGSEAVL